MTSRLTTPKFDITRSSYRQQNLPNKSVEFLTSWFNKFPERNKFETVDLENLDCPIEAEVLSTLRSRLV